LKKKTCCLRCGSWRSVLFGSKGLFCSSGGCGGFRLFDAKSEVECGLSVAVARFDGVVVVAGGADVVVYWCSVEVLVVGGGDEMVLWW
jgi:hypothetical protein